MENKYGIIILATNKYLPIGLRLVHKLNHFYKGKSKITIHLVTDTDASDYLKYDNIIYHNRVAPTWNDSTTLKLDICKYVIENYDYDYLGCLDSDSNAFLPFTEEDIFANSFVVKHVGNAGIAGNGKHYENNPKSSAYVDPSEYQEIYFQTCYFGGTVKNMNEMVDSAIVLRELDRANGIIAKWTDESYLQKYFMKHSPEKIFDYHDKTQFPLTMDDKGNSGGSHLTGKYTKPFESLSEFEYEELLKNIKKLKDVNCLWDIHSDKLSYNLI